MVAVNVYPGSLQWLGLAPESSYGTPAANPSIFIPLEAVPKYDGKPTLLTDAGLRGTMGTSVNAIQGLRYDELSYKCLLFADSVFPHFVNILGDAAQTGTASTPTTTLSSPSAVGATSITVAASIPSGTLIQIDTGGNAELVTTSAVTGAGPYTLTVPALQNAHASGVTVCKVIAPFTQTEALLNGGAQGQPKSYTGWLYLQGGQAIRIPGMMLADLKLTMKPNEKATLDADWWGLPGTFVAAPAYTPSTLLPYNTSNLTISVGGTQTAAVSDIEIDFKRDTKMAIGATGSHSPVSIFMGALTVTGTLQAIYQGVTDQFLVDLFNNTQPAVSASIYADGDSTHPFTIQMSKCVFKGATPQGSMTSYMTINAPFEALLNTTDALDGLLSPAQAKIVSASSTLF